MGSTTITITIEAHEKYCDGCRFLQIGSDHHGEAQGTCLASAEHTVLRWGTGLRRWSNERSAECLTGMIR